MSSDTSRSAVSPSQPISRQQPSFTPTTGGFFLTPYWEAIFAQDAERKQDREEAQATGKVMAETYARFSYQLIEMPMTGVEERADLVAGFLEGV